MADWSAADERRYQELLRLKAQLQAREEGGRRLQAAQQRVVRRPAQPAANPFSLFRATVGAVRDAAQGAWDAVDSVGDYIQSKTGIGGFVTGKMADNGVVQYVGAKEFQRRTKANGGTIFDAQLPQIQGSENAGTAEKVVRGIGSFLVPFSAAGKALKIGEAASVVGRGAKVVAASAAANFATIDPVENNLAKTAKDLLGIDSKALDTLIGTADDDEFEARVKGTIASLPLDVGMEVVTEGFLPMLRAVRQARAIKQDSKGLIDAVQQDIKVKRYTAAAAERLPKGGVRVNGKDPLAPTGALPKAANDETTVSAEKLLTPAKPKAEPAKPTADAPVADPAAPAAPKATVEVTPDRIKPAEITTLDEFTAYARKVVDQTADPSRLDKLAKALVEDPHNALAELKIDPAKLDHSLFSDPEKIVALQNSLGDLVEDVAKKTGRTGTVVSNAETIRAGRALAMTPRTLKSLMDRTGNLASHLTGARILVGQHAHKLVSDVDLAIEEITKKGGAGKAYNDFLETLSRHSVLLGTLRGAGSEIGRALQSLQAVAQVKEAGKVITDQAEQALSKARALAAKDAERAANKAAKVEAKDAAKAAAKAATEVDQGAPEVLRFLEQMTEGRVDDAALAAIAAKHGIEPQAVTKQLGLDWAQVKKLREAEAKYTDLFKDLTTDAGKLRLLNKLKGAEGDLEKLTRITKSRDMNWLQRADAVVQDTRGNLFSIGTASMNVLGAGTMLGLKTLTHGLAAMGHATLGIGSARHAVAARTHLLKTWASVHAPIMAFSDAMTNTWAIMQKEGLEEASAIFDTAGFNATATKLQTASIGASGKMERGMIREELATDKGWYISPERLNAISEAAEEWPIGRFGQLGLQWLSRGVATAINVPGAVSRLSTAAFINAPDQFAGTLASRVGAHSAAVDKAVEEAAEAELTGKALYDYIKNRSIQLADGIDGVSAEPFDDGVKEVLEKEGFDYAQKVLFQDDLEWSFNQTASTLPGRVPIIGSMIVPFPRTPLRILETTAIDYTPLGVFKDRVREAWLTGDTAARGEIAARYTIASGILLSAFYLASDRTIVGFDGGPASSARLSRGSYSLRIGDDVVEFNRLDPLGTILGFGADLRAAMQSAESDDDVMPKEVLEAAIWATFKNVFTKTWMQSLRQLNELAAARNHEQFEAKLGQFFSSLGTRAVPASGVQRQYDKWDEGIVRESAGFIQGTLKASWGAGKLPVKRDAILGRPVDLTAGERLIGVKGGPQDHDPLVEELEKLSFDVPPPRRSVKGVKLNSEQMSRWLELRGQVVRDETGLTLEEKLSAIIKDPEWADMGRNARVDAARDAMKGYARLATDQLLREDDAFAYAVLKEETWDGFRAQDRTRQEADAETLKLAAALGIKVPE